MLETRLAHLAAMVDENTRLADIGTDHAYLPIDLVKSGKIDFAIASDVAEGPLDNAKTDILAAGLSKNIETRLGSGLETLRPEDNIQTVVIAGMGGKLMSDLLETAKVNGNLYPTLILEPNIGEPRVRKWLMENNYQIIQEEIIDTAGHIYELIKATLTTDKHPLTDKELLFGPFLLKEKTAVFTKKWTNQLAYQKQLLLNLNKAKNKDMARISEVEQRIKFIEGELEND
ncbi:class I SAM-dependent methyltransferase [Lactobacillus mulieris]|uniref:tRNA (adenine(22)-N(1))-methyltransferase n=1 Tax=Lactobacillus mulieris TaxID=2508708 RepID=UPI001432B5D5|nr:class I SAM-dependent methyltransferase [Lactobacillus mulieris]MCF1782884.1 class I SAM-dependent methyltransferase [Lactobacillus mulieris]MCW8103861.1 class I SAM-dependent methyltransferase [Lactobacillus mulieris]MDK6802604.1 class I SAM-dependent methyltransferase [Lactobacillus mulieris]MDK8381720.1 class I SAM-dependent methyltransferase [Lactobacillus mulieris]MDT9619930.1 class I SAM-dependent methyltransferase [Lactobacillus mulieris]